MTCAQRTALAATLGGGMFVLGLFAALYFFLWQVSDTTRGALVARALERALPGDFSIGALGAGLPGNIELHDVRIASPSHDPVIEVDHLTAHSSWASLLRLAPEFFDIVVDHAVVHVRQQKADGPIDIAAAFDERELHKQPPGDTVEPARDGPPHVRCRNISVREAEVFVNVPGTRLHVTKARVQDANLWVDGNTLGLEAKALADADLAAAGQAFGGRRIQVALRPTQFRFAVNNKRVDTPGVHVEMRGLTLDANGTLDATEAVVKAVAAHVKLVVDSKMPLLAARLPPKVRTLLAGGIKLRIEVAGTGARQEATVAMEGDRLRFADIPVDDGRFRLLATPVKDGLGLRLSVQEALMHVQFIAVRIRGDAALMLDGSVLRHDLHIDTESLPLRRILIPFVNAPEYIPARVSLELHTEGPTLWPLGSQVTFKALASGLSAPIMRVLPDPFMVAGALHTHPDAIDIEALRLGAEGSPLRIEGRIPLRPDGVLDIVGNVHLKH